MLVNHKIKLILNIFAIVIDLREFALCYSRHPGDMRGRSRVPAAPLGDNPGSAAE